MKLSSVNKGTYVCAKFTDETLDALCNLQESLQLYDAVARHKIHSTICYSRVNIPFVAREPEPILISNRNWLEVWDTPSGKTLVLMMDSEHLKERHKYTEILGGTYDFPEYKPHLTLAYDIGARHIELKDVDIPIVALYEDVEDLDLDWIENNS